MNYWPKGIRKGTCIQELETVMQQEPSSNIWNWHFLFFFLGILFPLLVWDNLLLWSSYTWSTILLLTLTTLIPKNIWTKILKIILYDVVDHQLDSVYECSQKRKENTSRAIGIGSAMESLISKLVISFFPRFLLWDLGQDWYFPSR